jgi:hypothetical protein
MLTGDSTMRKSTLSARQLGFERLENRTVLNGTVMVDSQTTTPGTLTIAGDNHGNAVIVHQIGKNADGDPIIQVLGAGTKLNNRDTGKTGYSFTFGAASGDDITAIDFEMGGSDVVTFYNTTVSGPITVNMDDPISGGVGNGNDVLSMYNVHSTGDAINVSLGNGTNVAALVRVSSGGDFTLTGGDGRNAIALNTVSADTNTTKPDTFTVQLGTGTFNTVAMVYCTDGPNGTLDISDIGADGILTGVLNNFAHQSDVTTFRFRAGDLRNNKA